jgi:protein O-mannosyl-transferase
MRAALAALTLAAYANSFGLGFVLDAHRLVLEDKRVHATTAANLLTIFTRHYWYPHAQDRLYRPFTTLSFLFNYAILGNAGQPAGYHVLNFLLHAANVLLLFELARRLFARALPGWDALPAFFAAALWAVHPVGTESVANLAGRADLLSTLGVLAALLLYTGGRPMRLPRFAGLLAFSLIGFLSKESAAVLPALMLLCDLSGAGDRLLSSAKPDTHRPSARSHRARAYAAVLGALALALLARLAVFASTAVPEMPFVDNPLHGAGFWTARLTALKIVGMDLLLLVWPANLAFDHSYNQIPLARYTDPAVWLTLAIAAEIIVVVTLRRRRDPLLFFAAGWVGICLLPTSNLIQLIGSIMAVRFLYLPSIGFAIAVSALAFRLPNWRLRLPTGALLMTLAIALCAARTLARNPAWQSDLSLASADVNSVPHSFRVHGLLASALLTENPAANLDAAIREAELAWGIEENLPPAARDDQAASDLATYCRTRGDRLGGPSTPAGRAWYERALDVFQHAVETAEVRMRNFDETQRAHGFALPVRGGYGGLYLDLGETYAALGQTAQVLDAFRNARLQDPRNVKAYDRSIDVYTAGQNWDALAVALHEKAIVFGLAPSAFQAFAAVYAHIPGGVCALAGEGGARSLNYGCPATKSCFCRAAVNVAALYRDARLPDQARRIEATTAARGCS